MRDARKAEDRSPQTEGDFTLRSTAYSLRPFVRLGVVAYLNMQPLIYGLEREADVQLRLGPPSALARWLEAGEIDLGMAPVASIFRHPEWPVVPGSMIGSRGPVASVLALGGGAPRDWKRLRPDSHSMTSNALARVVLRGVHGIEPEAGEPIPLEDWEPPARPADGEAFVAIGSRALRWRPRWLAAGGTAIDLGEAWQAWTGLPCVCALWAARPGVRLGAWPARLDALKRQNMARLARIAVDWPAHREDQLSPAEAERYLSENISYDFDAAAREGLERFYAAGRALDLFPEGWRLRLHDQ
jgi:chorismate dehydratase